MKSFKFLPLFLLCAMLLSLCALPAAAVEGQAGENPTPSSVSALVLDRRSGEILYGKGLDTRVYPADTVQLMTALLAVEAVETGKCSYQDMVTVSDAAEAGLGEDSIRCGLQSGEQLTLEALLQCVLIASGGDAANTVAEYIGGTVPEFVVMMNARATELGCADTAFTNPHGAYDDGQYTTARDFSRIASECTRHEKLMRICGTAIAELAETNLSPARTLKNTNALLCDESPYGPQYLYENASGMKAGSSARAGYALAATAERSGMELLCAVFGGELNDTGCTCFTDAVTLFDWVFNNYSYQEVLKSTENIASVDIALGMDATYVNIRPATSIIVLLPNNYDPESFQKDIRVYALENRETVTAPVTAGEVLGEVTVSHEGRSYGTVKLVASSSVQLSRVQYIRQQVRETTQKRSFRMTVIVLVLLFLLYLAWVAVYRVKRIRHVRAVRAVERERLLQAEAVMKHAESPNSPGIRFFNARGATSSPPARLEEAQPEEALPEKQPARPAIDIPIDDEKPAPESQPEKVVQLFPAAKGKREPAGEKPAAEKAPPARPAIDIPIDEPALPPGDLLAGAVMVAALEPEKVREETAEEKAERDYFAEFFRPKK